MTTEIYKVKNGPLQFFPLKKKKRDFWIKEYIRYTFGIRNKEY